jgi:DNA-binding CsgD family transcriptional regulator
MGRAKSRTHKYLLGESPRADGLYLKEFHNRREREVCYVFSEILTNPIPSPVLHFWEHSLIVDRSAQLRSDHYNLVLRPIEVDEVLILRVRAMGQIFGALYVARAAGEPPYTPHDRKMLESLAGFVAHGMTPATVDEGVFVESGDRGLIVADRAGCVRYGSDASLRLLAMALMPRFSPSAEWRGLHGPAPEIAALRQRLAATANGEIGQPPPVLRLPTPWGEFVLRAYWLGPTDGAEQTEHVGVTIERRIPRSLALLRRIETLPLTSREKQLCLLLARDPSRDDLADAMGVAAATAINHQRSVYAKLGVHSRAALIAALEPRENGAATQAAAPATPIGKPMAGWRSAAAPLSLARA